MKLPEQPEQLSRHPGQGIARDSEKAASAKRNDGECEGVPCAATFSAARRLLGGVCNTSDMTSAAVASVTIKTVIPGTVPSTSKSCITSSIVGISTIAGWTSAVRKSGGCDREIQVELANRASGQSAQCSFLYRFALTRIDSGLLR